MILLTIGIVLSAPSGGWQTLVFVTTDCPVAQRFTPELKRIMKDFRSVTSFKFVYEDTGISVDKVKAHHTEFKIDCPLEVDNKQWLAKQYHVTGVPTVVVRSGSSMAYKGRIDDSYGSDFKWHPAKQKDLRNALTALKNGVPVKVKRTKVIGCALNR